MKNIREGILQFCRYPRTVKEIIKQFNVSQGTISYHLKSLCKTGFLVREKKEKERPTYLCKFMMDVADPCYFCDEKKDVHKHHIIPKRVGGEDVSENILRLCKRCYSKLHTKKAFLDLEEGYYFMRDFKTKEILKYPSMRHIHNLRKPPINSIKKAIKKNKFKVEGVVKNG